MLAFTARRENQERGSTLFTIGKTYHFSASHQLLHLPDKDHPCARPHGHNYSVKVMVSAEGLATLENWIVDYGVLDRTIGRYVDNVLDHRDLNAIFGAKNTTAEALAKHLHEVVSTRYAEQIADASPTVEGMFFSVEVKETEKTFANFTNAEGAMVERMGREFVKKMEEEMGPLLKRIEEA